MDGIDLEQAIQLIEYYRKRASDLEAELLVCKLRAQREIARLVSAVPNGKAAGDERDDAAQP